MPQEPYRKTVRHYNIEGHAHSLTWSCLRRQPFFARPRTCQWLVESILQAKAQHAFDIWAYVFMPEHVHLLIWPTSSDYRIGRIQFAIKTPIGAKALRFVRQHAPEFLDRMQDKGPRQRAQHRFWQKGGGYDRNLWSPSAIWTQIDYIHANPVRRGLVECPWQWRWSSAAEYAGVGQGPIAVDWENLPARP